MALLRQLRYFVAVAEERHFGHAAHRLGIAQPGLSQQIKALERVVGAPLFVRDRRSVELTKAGETLFAPATRVVELADRAVRTARLASEGKTGLLKVGTRALGSHPLADELLRQFSERHPEVVVEVHPGFVPASINELLWHRLDVAIIVALSPPREAVRYLRLGTLEPLVALPLGHHLASLERVPRARLLNETFLDWPRTFNPDVIDPFRDAIFGDDRPLSTIEVPDLADTTRLARVAAGEGFTIIVSAGVELLTISNVVFRRLEDPVPELEWGLAWVDNAASPFVHPFVELARELVERTPDKPRRGIDTDVDPTDAVRGRRR